jgi:hypothetical protein
MSDVEGTFVQQSLYLFRVIPSWLQLVRAVEPIQVDDVLLAPISTHRTRSGTA